MIEAVGYLRVSTRSQKRTGFGLKAQENMIQSYCDGNHIRLVALYTEIASGLDNERPIIRSTINLCRRNDYLLIVARQSRLSRTVLFIATLLATKFRYLCVDSPHANNFQKHLQAAIDQDEAERIQDNTRRSLRAAVAKGVRLGGNVKKLKQTLKRKKAAYLKKVAATFIREKEKYKTMRAIAERLNRLGLAKQNGKKGNWTVSEVFDILQSLAKKKTDNHINNRK